MLEENGKRNAYFSKSHTYLSAFSFDFTFRGLVGLPWESPVFEEVGQNAPQLAAQGRSASSRALPAGVPGRISAGIGASRRPRG